MSTAVEEFKVPAEALDVQRAVKDLVADLPETLTVATREEAQRTTDLLAAVARQRREAEAARKALVQPLNNHVKFINQTFKKNTEPLDRAEALLKKGLLDFQRREQEAANAARLAAEQEAARARTVALLEGKDDEPVPVPEPVAAPRTTVHGYGGSSTIVKRWTYEVTDMMALVKAVAVGEVPLDFLQVNSTQVRAAIADKADPVRNCPGLNIYQAEGVSVR